MQFAEKVYFLVSKIPKGKVSTYKAIAKKLGGKGYRAVGNALRVNPNVVKVPCHRVVCSDGSLGGYCGVKNSRKKILLLRKEGVIVVGGRIKDFKKKLFKV